LRVRRGLWAAVGGDEGTRGATVCACAYPGANSGKSVDNLHSDYRCAATPRTRGTPRTRHTPDAAHLGRL